MATEHVRQSLEDADECLRRAIAQLVEMRFGIPQCGPALDSAVEKLRSAIENPMHGSERDDLKPVVQRIRAHAVRVQALLDSAASFYFGYYSAMPSAPDTYAPDGQILREAGGGGGLLLNA